MWTENRRRRVAAALVYLVTASVAAGDAKPSSDSDVAGRLFWGDPSPNTSFKKEFDDFVRRFGGIVDPSENLGPKSFGKSFGKFERSKSTFGSDFISKRRGHLFNAFGHKRFEGNNIYKGTLLGFSHDHETKGCEDSLGFHAAGEVWYSRGCRRHKCIHFRGYSFIETVSCDSQIYNTTYKCVVMVDVKAKYPHCCPTYECNPDNLGNRVNV